MKRVFLFFAIALLSTNVFAEISQEIESSAKKNSAVSQINCKADGYIVGVSYKDPNLAYAPESIKFDGLVTIQTPNGENIVYKHILVTANEFNDYTVQAFSLEQAKWQEALSIEFPSEEGSGAAITVKLPTINGKVDSNFTGYGSEDASLFELKTVLDGALGNCEVVY